jgi:hypothetical protein
MRGPAWVSQGWTRLHAVRCPRMGTIVLAVPISSPSPDAPGAWPPRSASAARPVSGSDQGSLASRFTPRKGARQSSQDEWQNSRPKPGLRTDVKSSEWQARIWGLKFPPSGLNGMP